LSTLQSEPCPEPRPSRISLILVAHGDRGDDKSNRWLLDHRDALREQRQFLAVEAGVLKGEPTVEAALDAAVTVGPDRVLVYPVCMSDGYFVRKILKDRIAATNCPLLLTVLPPLGLDPALPHLFLEHALKAAEQLDCATQAARLLVVGHGSKFGPASAAATQQMVGALRSEQRFASVEPAYLEEAPFLHDALAENSVPTVVAGFFSGVGMHAVDDVPTAIEETGAHATYTGPIGLHTAIPDLIRSAAGRAL